MLIFKWQFTSERFQEKLLSGPLQWILEHSSKPFTVHRDVPSSTDRVMGDLHNMPRSGDLSWSIVGHFHGFLCRINQNFCITSSVTYHCPPSVSLHSLSPGRCGDNLNFFLNRINSWATIVKLLSCEYARTHSLISQHGSREKHVPEPNSIQIYVTSGRHNATMS